MYIFAAHVLKSLQDKLVQSKTPQSVLNLEQNLKSLESKTNLANNQFTKSLFKLISPQFQPYVFVW